MTLKRVKKIKKEDLIFKKRPGTGIPVDNLKNILGKRINKNLKAETIKNIKIYLNYF